MTTKAQPIIKTTIRYPKLEREPMLFQNKIHEKNRKVEKK